MSKPELTGVDGREAPVRFAGLTYQRFREMALDPALSTHEKIGYPDGFRAGFEAAVLADVAGKLPALARPGSTVLDIGAGCDELAHRLIAQTAERQQSLVLVDSPEMLDQLPDGAHVRKLPGRGDDPRFIHSDEFDDLVRDSREPYQRHFDADLGAGGWTQINAAHTALINAALDAITGRGLTALITFGTAHKYMIRRSMAQRGDVVLEDTGALFA